MTVILFKVYYHKLSWCKFQIALCTLVASEKRDVCLKGWVKDVQLSVLLLFLSWYYKCIFIVLNFFLLESCSINKVFLKKVFLLTIYFITCKSVFKFFSIIADVTYICYDNTGDLFFVFKTILVLFSIKFWLSNPTCLLSPFS